MYKYIKNALLTGKSREAIKSALLANGWWEDTIETAMTMIFDQPVPKATAFNQFRSKKNALFFLIFLVFASILIGVLGGFLPFIVTSLMAHFGLIR